MLAKVGKAPRLRSPKPNCKNLLSPQDKLALIQLSETCHSEHAEKKINVKGGSAEGLWNFNSMFNSFFLNSFAAATQLAQFWVQARSTPQSERNTAGREQGRGGWRSTFFCSVHRAVALTLITRTICLWLRQYLDDRTWSSRREVIVWCSQLKNLQQGSKIRRQEKIKASTYFLTPMEPKYLSWPNLPASLWASHLDYSWSNSLLSCLMLETFQYKKKGFTQTNFFCS